MTGVLLFLFGLTASLLWIYLILLFLRTLSGWFPLDPRHPALRLLGRLCDPYLNYFRRFRWMTLGRFDFSPLAAILLVSFVANILQTVSQTGRLTVGIVLAILVQALWGALQYFFLFFLVLSLIRYLSLRLRWSGQLVWDLVDSVIMPVAQFVMAPLARRRVRPYPYLLLGSTIIFGVLLVGGSVGVAYATSWIINLPF